MYLSGYIKKKFLIKIKSEPHLYKYDLDKPIRQKFNVLTQIYTAPAGVLHSMKIGAAMERQKGRDFYDCMCLMGKTEPDWKYLAFKFDIDSLLVLKQRLLKCCENVDFNLKSKDYKALVYRKKEVQESQLVS